MFYIGSYMLSLIEAKVEKQGRPCWAQDKSHLHSSQVWLMCLQIHTALCITLMLIYITMIRKVLNKHIMFVVFLWFDSTRPQLGRKCPREKPSRKYSALTDLSIEHALIKVLYFHWQCYIVSTVFDIYQGATRGQPALPPPSPRLNLPPPTPRYVDQIVMVS